MMAKSRAMMQRHGSSSAFSHGRGLWRKGSPSPAQFDNAVLRELPVDPEPRNFVRSAVAQACFSRVAPTPIANPELVIASPDALRLVGIDAWSMEACGDGEAADSDGDDVSVDELVPFLAGNALFPGSDPAAQCYCGHQFGYFSGQLGDGAALYLGEVVTENLRASGSGETTVKERWEMQLKGSGLTPYSRTADGRKVLRSSLREFLASEHMHALGIPTTRAGSVILSRDTTVLRDMFYDGHAAHEPTAVVLRIARSFLRFGSFEIFKDSDPFTGRSGPSAALPLSEKQAMMRRMLNFTTCQYFPEIWQTAHSGEGGANDTAYISFFTEVVKRTARLVAQWQAVGFCHGVLNTDNMSITGDTLDYGPFGFMEHFNPDHVCNSSDDSGRYRFAAQPEICKWNCRVLADQLELVVVGDENRKSLAEALSSFDKEYEREYYGSMSAKLGLLHRSIASSDRALIDDLIATLAKTGADYTCVFRALANVEILHKESHDSVVQDLVSVSETLEQVLRRYSKFTDDQHDAVSELMKKSPMQARRYGITPEVYEMMTHERAQRTRFRKISTTERRAHLVEIWSRWIGRYVMRLEDELSNVEEKSVDDPGKKDDAVSLHDQDRHRRMGAVNPVFVLRNHVAQHAIDAATKGDYEQVERIFHLLTHPFDDTNSDDDLQLARPLAPEKTPLCVSCSS